MRKLIVTEFMSLDGVIEDPQWTMPYWNDETAQFKAAETTDNHVLLLGRVTYEGFATAWPQRSDADDPGATYFNNVRKYVVTHTLDKAEWNNSVIIKGNIMEEIRKLKQQDGEDLVVHGSGMLARTLIQAGLVDHIRLLIYPVVLGKGKCLFEEGTSVTLKLLEANAFSTGVMALVYTPVQEA